MVSSPPEPLIASIPLSMRFIKHLLQLHVIGCDFVIGGGEIRTQTHRVFARLASHQNEHLADDRVHVDPLAPRSSILLVEGREDGR